MMHQVLGEDVRKSQIKSLKSSRTIDGESPALTKRLAAGADRCAIICTEGRAAAARAVRKIATLILSEPITKRNFRLLVHSKAAATVCLGSAEEGVSLADKRNFHKRECCTNGFKTRCFEIQV